MRKALELKDGELKAFFIKASARQKWPGGREFMAANGCSQATGMQPWHTRAGSAFYMSPRSQAEGTAGTRGKAQPASRDPLPFSS